MNRNRYKPLGHNSPAPTFLGLGAPKAATTWLFQCLREHPSIFIPDEKEIGVFSCSDEIDERLTEYLAHFHKSGTADARGEIFVLYLSSPLAAEQIKRYLPDAKLFVSLRNPVDQIYSHYWHLKRQNFHRWGDGNFVPPTSFASAIDELYDDLVAPACYAQHLKRWLAFFPREQIHIMLYEDIESDPLRELKSLYCFLEVDDGFVPSFLNRRDAAVRAGVSPRSDVLDRLHTKTYDGLNRFVYHKMKQLIGVSAAARIKDTLRIRQLMQAIFYRKGYPKMDQKDKKRLVALLSEDICELENLLGRDLSHWLG